MIKINQIFIILAFSLVCIGYGASTNFGGYTVEMITPDMLPGTPPEPTAPVSAFEVPPSILLLAFAMSVSPIMAFPVELFLFIKLFSILGYRKVTEHTVFKNAARNRIYTFIEENPGIFFNDLVRLTNINRGTLTYHLAILKLTRKISVPESSKNSRYFKNAGTYTDTEKTILRYIRDDTDRRIFRLLLENPDVTRHELGENLGLSVSTISWRMKRLSDEKIIWIEKAGKNVQYGINPEMRRYLIKYLNLNNEVIPLLTTEPVPESA